MPEEPTDHSSPQTDSTTWKEAPLLFIKGFLMGSADIVPGVSGGTMALILGIYSRLIHAIKSFSPAFFKRLFTFRLRAALNLAHWKFIVVLLSGILGAVLFFTKIVPLQLYMFTDPELIFGLFFGLIVASVVILFKAIESFTGWHAVCVVAGVLIGFWVVTLVPSDTPEGPWFVFLSGAIAICAMILPGISGSYLLLILRKYDFILHQLSLLGTAETVSGIVVLLPFIAGAVAGLGLFSRVLSWLLDSYYAKTLAVLIGFLVGSLYVIWPYQNRTYQEFVRHTEVVEYNSAKAQEIRVNPPDINRPEYRRIKPVDSQQNAAAAPEKVQIQTVKKKLIASRPFIPFVTVKGAGTDHLWSGIAGMIIGLLAVLGLDFLRK